MKLSIGEKIIYPSYGPCLISAVVKKLVGGTSVTFYRLALLDDSGGELFIPVEKIKGLGIRQLLGRSDISKLLSRLSQEAETPILPTTARNWKQRVIDNSKLLASGSAFDLAAVVESLTDLNETKALSPRDRQTLDKARRILICEISEVMGETKAAVEERVDSALKIRQQAVKRLEEKMQ